MLTVIVIDDEPIICELIRRLADWEKYDLELLGFEHNGINAYHTIMEKKPDIVITDIRIPGTDGLDLIRRIQKNGLTTRFIVISGYRQFEYAHSALQFGVTDYLLKPINKEELNHALEKLTAAIRADRDDRQRLEEMQNELTTQSTQLRNRFLDELIAGQIENDALNTEEINLRYHYDFRDSYCGIFILKAGCRHEEDRTLVPMLFSRVIPVAEELFSQAAVFETLEEGTRLYCLYQFVDPQMIRGIWAAMTERLQEVLAMFETLTLTICPAPEAASPSSLPSCMRNAEHSVHLRLTARHAGVVRYDEGYSCRVVKTEDVFSQEARNVFREAAENGVSDEISRQIRRIFQPLEENGVYWKYDPEVLFSLCTELTGILTLIPACVKEVPDAFRGVMQSIDDADTVNDLISRFRKKLLQTLDPYFRSVRERSQRPVQMARNYIREHFALQIDLETVAEYAGISPNYLSTLFKKETGMSFSDYVTQVRITEAKRLLRTTQLSVTEIAERAGYIDSKYFTKVFSKECGISPKNYRKL